MTEQQAIIAENLTRDFQTVRALDGLCLEVPQGQVFGFLGPNGAGKTTTLRLLLGLLEPSAGRAVVLGYDTRTQAAAIRERSGALLEPTGLYERLSAEDNLDFFARIWHMPAKERQSRSRELLEHLHLWDRRKESVGRWSRGMKQKLAIARALLHRPALIFLDEPTAGLDPVAAASLREDIAGLAAREGATVFLTTHNLTEAEKLCQQVAVVRQGKLLTVGQPDVLRNAAGKAQLEILGRGFSAAVLEAARRHPAVADLELRDGNLIVHLQPDAEATGLVNLLVQAGAQIEEVRKNQASLEDAFLKLVEEEEND